jgi:hypothetical protein
MSEARFAGVDWASEEHAVCVVDEHGRIVEGRRFVHDEPGIRALCVRLLGLRVALVALERPDGLLIERLLDAGLSVVAVHPNQVKAMRPRYSVAGGKSDVFDSFVLAELAEHPIIRTARQWPEHRQHQDFRPGAVPRPPAISRRRADVGVAVRQLDRREQPGDVRGYLRPGTAKRNRSRVHLQQLAVREHIDDRADTVECHARLPVVGDHGSGQAVGDGKPTQRLRRHGRRP